jgi:hypothetical protein
VEIQLKQKEKTAGYLMLFVGTQKKGKKKNRPGCISGTSNTEKTVWLKKLEELTNVD